MINHLLESLEGRQLFAGGALDSTYAANGSRSLTFRTATAAEAVTPSQLLTDSPGRSYVIATTASTFQIQRLTAAGQLDTSYGKRGSVLFTRDGSANTKVYGKGVDKAQLDFADRQVLLLDNKRLRLTSNGGVIATYRTTDVDGSTWDIDDNGLYGVRLLANSVKCSDGTYLPGVSRIGILQVAIV